MLSDSALAIALVGGEAAARRAAWFHFSPMVRRAVRPFVTRFLDEEDLVQEVFLQLFLSLPTLRDLQALRAFVIGVAVRTGQDHRRRGWRRQRTELLIAPEQLSWEPMAHQDVSLQHAVMRVERLLRKIRARDRAAFVLRFVEGMTIKEVANVLGTSIITVTRRCSRAHARLKLLAERDSFLSAYVPSVGQGDGADSSGRPASGGP